MRADVGVEPADRINKLPRRLIVNVCPQFFGDAMVLEHMEETLKKFRLTLSERPKKNEITLVFSWDTSMKDMLLREGAVKHPNTANTKAKRVRAVERVYQRMKENYGDRGNKKASE